MIEWTELEKALHEHGISTKDQQSVKDFLSFFPFGKRQQLFGIMLGFPEKLPLFVDLIVKKQALKNGGDDTLLLELLDIEEREVTFAIQALS